MKKIIFSILFLLSVVAASGQSVEFIRNNEVVKDGSTITVTELENNEMNPAVYVRNSTGDTVASVLKVTSVLSTASGSCAYCGFGSGQCVSVALGTSLGKGMNIKPGQVVDPQNSWMLGYKDEKNVNAIVKYELKAGATLKFNDYGELVEIVDEGTTVSTITIRFLYGSYAPTKVDQSIIWKQSISDMAVGERIKLNGISTSGLTITYTSGDPSKVEITEDGYLHALATTGEEYVIITASQKGNEIYNAAMPIVQSVRVGKAKAGIHLSNSVQTYDGETKHVTVTTEPEGLPYTVKYYQGTYEVTDTKNADVYYVIVEVITDVYYANTSTWLIVNKAPQIIVWNQEQTLEEGGELVLNASNSSSLQEIEYYSETPSVADVIQKDGKAYLVGKSKGVARVMARVKGDNNHEEGAEVRTFTVETPTGIDKMASSAISCYPTYVTDNLFVDGISIGDKIILSNMAGSEVINMIAQNSLEKIDCVGLNSGVYLLQIIRNGESKTYKVMKR